MMLILKPKKTLQENHSFSSNEHWHSFGSLKLFRGLSEWFIYGSEGFGWLIPSWRTVPIWKPLAWTDVGQGILSHPSPLPVPLLQVFAGTSAFLPLFLFAVCKQSPWLSGKSSVTSMRHLLSSGFFGILAVQFCILHTVLLNIGWQEVVYITFWVCFLKFQKFKKKMKTGYCLKWNPSPAVQIIVSSQCVCMPFPLTHPTGPLFLLTLSPSSVFYFCHCFTVFFLLLTYSALHSHTPSAVFWYCV